jgi:hypothetical protein
MSWLFSQALVEEYLGDTYSDGELSAPLSGSLTQLAYCAPDRMTKFSRLSRFGMTYKPLTEDRGEELLTSYLADFHAKTSALQERGQESTESDPGCGHIWQELLARYDQDTSTWRTPQCSLLEDSIEFSGTWPRWGLMQDGVSYQQQTLVPHTKEIGSGSWPTPRSCSAMASTITPESAWAENRFPNLETVVGRRIWPTPTAHNAKEGAYPAELTRNTPTLAAQAGGTLNPMWVEWLMGWPLGWTDLKPLETDKFRSWQQQHGICSSEKT